MLIENAAPSHLVPAREIAADNRPRNALFPCMFLAITWYAFTMYCDIALQPFQQSVLTCLAFITIPLLFDARPRDNLFGAACALLAFLLLEHAYVTIEMRVMDILGAYVAVIVGLMLSQCKTASKTNFLRRMSHDIRTPINGIRGMVEMGNAFDGDVAKQRECRQKIWIASGILLDLVSEVLDMSKLESGEVELELRSTNLVALNDEVCEMLERQAGELHVTIIKEQDRIEHPYVRASQIHLKRVIMNIASNAVKYNKPGGTVRLSCEELHAEGATAMYRITVADTGIGMSKEFQQHLFEPFSREVQKLEAQPSGTGLGTVIAKQLTELMGGAIAFDSELDVGTTCVITLPLVIDFDAQQRNEELDKQGDVTLAGMSILLVEDNELNREIAEFVLDQAGAHVTTAFDGREAVDAFAAAAPGAFDLVLMDIMMPNMNGYEATRAIRAMNRTDAKCVPIVAMSANAFADDVAYSRESGMNDHLAKPIDADKLVRALARYRKDA